MEALAGFSVLLPFHLFTSQGSWSEVDRRECGATVPGGHRLRKGCLPVDPLTEMRLLSGFNLS